jgi:hypothetical protein
MPRPSSQLPFQNAPGFTGPLPHGTLHDFYGGIDKRIGVVSLDFFEQMRMEHCVFEGHDFEFTSDNYGIPTRPLQEWLLVTEGAGVGDCEYVKSWNSEIIRRRTPANWWDHLNPSHPAIRHSDIVDAKQRAERVLKDLCIEFDLLKEEIIAIILFTGPMYNVYNGILSNFPAKFVTHFAPANFTTTIHAIISAIQKLSLLTPVQRIVFRGTSGRGFLPDSFWAPQGDLNVYGYTEFGVMSMTSSMETALRYSSYNPT